MRKKKITEQIDLLVKKNNELYDDNVLLSRELEKKEQIIKELNNKISELLTEVDTLTLKLSNAEKTEVIALEVNENSDSENKSDALVQKDEDVFSSSPDSEPVNEEATEEKAVQFTVPQSKIIDVEPKIADASQIIGKAVLKCAEICNVFTCEGGQNAKDLVNLALGRTEVFKAEILALVSQYDDFSDATAEVNSKFSSLEEYFDLLKKQL